MRVRVDIDDEGVRRVPPSGPLIVVANHPFGGLEGLALAALMEKVRPDAKLLVNYLLACIPEMRETSFFVDPFGSAAARSRNRGELRAAARWIQGGGALVVFPAGEVSHWRIQSGCVTDPPWSTTVARMVHRTRATVLPVFMDGRNGALFQLAGLMHPRLRTALLPRELVNKHGRTVHVEIGSQIPYSRLARLLNSVEPSKRLSDVDAERVMDYLRLRTYILHGRRPVAGSSRQESALHGLSPRVIAVAPGKGANVLASEVAGLPGECRLAEGGPFQVYCAEARQIPTVLQEIGRLREITFRAVGEGTGREIDIARFDEHYLHMFAWNHQRRQIVGAYRLGLTDQILAQSRLRGLYTSTLFDFKPRLLNQLNPALELGRSFVISEYQRDYAPLLLLWKGIGRFVAMRPRYRLLFGAVSISDEFQSMTKQLLMAFLSLNCRDAELSGLVHPRNPPRMRLLRDLEATRLAPLVGDMADVEELVREIESEQRTVPVLLRQYLKLNAKLLGFNVDPVFGNVIDGLLYVDLSQVDRAILDRFMGRSEATAFLAYHESRQAPVRLPHICARTSS